jgi:hypothetical protein
MPDSKLIGMVDPAAQREAWRSLTKAIGAELKEVQSIQGASGLEHPVQALATNEAAGSVIIVSADASPRVAALMQADVQAIMPDTKVLVARPVIIDLAIVMRRLLAPLGSSTPTMDHLKVISEQYNSKTPEIRQKEMIGFLSESFAPVAQGLKNLSLSTINQIVDVINQASSIDWTDVGDRIKLGTNEKTLDVSPLWNLDNTATDRKYGVCALPLYEFGESDWDLMLDPRRVDDLSDRLRELGVMQFFYPPPDQLALALIDNGVPDEREVIRAINGAPRLGHPLVGPELLTEVPPIADLANALKAEGYVVEAEFELEIASPNGTTTRGIVKVRPREALVARIIRAMNINIHFH